MLVTFVKHYFFVLNFANSIFKQLFIINSLFFFGKNFHIGT